MTERTYPDVVAEVAGAIAADMGWNVTEVDRRIARVAITRLGELGMLSSLYYDAIKAKAEKEKQG